MKFSDIHIVHFNVPGIFQVFLIIILDAFKYVSIFIFKKKKRECIDFYLHNNTNEDTTCSVNVHCAIVYLLLLGF